MYSTLRSGGKKMLKQMPTMWELARRSEEMMKGMVLPGTIFEELGFNYIGPMDGHDIKELVTTLDSLALGGVSTMSKQSSQDNLGMLDDAITHVNKNRASMGALQNRIMSTINNLNVYTENLEQANSRINERNVPPARHGAVN